jgi:TRAP-type mannitol/chloroaromatic compound transport system permease small subunit
MNKALSVTTTTLLLLLIANVFVDVVLRYAFNNSSIALQELEWHLFSAMFLLSIAYGLQNDTHVRVVSQYNINKYIGNE